MIKKKDFERLATEYGKTCPFPLVFSDCAGTGVFHHIPSDLHAALGIEPEMEPLMREWRKKSVEGSYRWGEAYFSATPLGLVAFSVPAIEDGALAGAFISGFVIFPEMAGDFDRDLSATLESLNIAGEFQPGDLDIPVISRRRIRRCADVLFRLVRKHGLSDFSTLPEKRERSAQQLDIAHYIETIKNSKQDTARIILEKQDGIMERVALGDIQGAKEILNEFLGYIFFDSGMNFDVLKIRVMELVVILSRKAIEYGVKPRELLGLNYSNLTELNEIGDFESLCHSLTRILERYIVTLSSVKKRKKSFECRKMREYIEGHFADRVTAEELAAAAGLSVGRALHLFREETGMSFTDYLKKARIDYGKYLLSATDRSLAEIAAAAGFADQSHFTRQFRELENITPLKYRLKNRPIA